MGGGVVGRLWVKWDRRGGGGGKYVIVSTIKNRNKIKKWPLNTEKIIYIIKTLSLFLSTINWKEEIILNAFGNKSMYNRKEAKEPIRKKLRSQMLYISNFSYRLEYVLVFLLIKISICKELIVSLILFISLRFSCNAFLN